MINLTSSKGKREAAGSEPTKVAVSKVARRVADRIAQQMSFIVSPVPGLF